ncbi:MAG: hypothetical protein ACI8Z5_000300 [Lentimonas sp.]|jgi:hypothetical protein
MPQLNIYLDEGTQIKARQAAKRAGCSLSSWARQQLSAAADTGKVWPEGYFELFASIDDAEFKAPERLPENLDAAREAL